MEMVRGWMILKNGFNQNEVSPLPLGVCVAGTREILVI
ncbi:MAG: hypothetical protein CM15mP106_7720 [Candidatus Neomarinimicrobiota bacterium]|nr:MAG: hypothetical protein CM15mP106_7720 [Candidatus Neomarinimicrobiota bacterium]